MALPIQPQTPLLPRPGVGLPHLPAPRAPAAILLWPHTGQADAALFSLTHCMEVRQGSTAQRRPSELFPKEKPLGVRGWGQGTEGRGNNGNRSV